MTRPLALAAVLLAVPAPAQAPPDQWPLVLRAAPATAILKRAIEVPSSGGTVFQADVYAPAQHGSRGTILFISGTADARGWRAYIEFAKLAVERGFVGVIPNKRFFPRAQSIAGQEMAHDDTVALLNALGKVPGLSDAPERTCAWLFSAGGLQLAGVFDPAAPRIGCLIGFYPAFDVPLPSPSPAWTNKYVPLAAFRTGAARRRIPMLIVRAGRDAEPLNQRLADFTAAALAVNADLTVVNLPDAQHAFDLRDDREWSRDTIRRAFDFASERLLPP